jgi:hypothetical protein
MKKVSKKKKKRAHKYETKLAVNGTFLDVIKASLLPDLKVEKPKKKKKA